MHDNFSSQQITLTFNFFPFTLEKSAGIPAHFSSALPGCSAQTDMQSDILHPSTHSQWLIKPISCPTGVGRPPLQSACGCSNFKFLLKDHVIYKYLFVSLKSSICGYTCPPQATQETALLVLVLLPAMVIVTDNN